MSSRRLPPLDTLRAFEAAGRHLSFTRAAGELSVTRTVISHQVRKLEKRLGTRLFERHGRGLELTDTGGMFMEDASVCLSPRGDEQFERIHPVGECGEIRTPGPVRVTAVFIMNGSLEEHGNSPWRRRFGTMPRSGL